MPFEKIISTALTNLVLFAALPFFCYFGYHKWRHKRTFREISRRAGFQLGPARYLAYSTVFALAAVAVFVIWPPPLEPNLREGSPWKPFDGLGLTGTSLVMALIYGFVTTGFCEELLFRGLIAGSLSRRLPLLWANLAQASIFLLPHLLILKIMPELWIILPIIFVGSLFFGWIRIKAGSIFGSWLMHATGNVAMCLSVAIRTVS